MPDFDSNVRKKLGVELDKLAGAEGNGTNIDAYKKYVSKLKALNKATEEQYAKDRFGLKKKYTPALHRQFVSLYEDAAKQGEILLRSLVSFKGSPVYKTIKNVQNILAADIRILRGADEKTISDGNSSLQKIMDDARMHTVDLTGTDIEKIGGNLSSRIPFNHVTPDGKELPGVFTPKKNVDIVGGYDAIISEMKKLYPNVSPFYEDFKAKGIGQVRNNLIKHNKNPDKYSEADLLLAALASLHESKPFRITTESINKAFKQCMPDTYDGFEMSQRSREGRLAVRYFADRVFAHTNSCGINTGDAKIKNGSRIDCRNSAMSSVADLFGVSGLICKAVPMKVVKDGVETEGTFMALAEGVDINNPTPASAEYDSNTKVFKNTNGLKDIADLQVIDFICGNIDRHAGNMFYKFDTSDPNPRKHKFIGVMGIDNDASFGTFVPANPDVKRNQLTPLNGMNVISESMKEKILGTSPDMLSVILRNTGLEPEQITAAGRRLQMLRDYVKKSRDRYEHPSDEDRDILRDDPDAILPGTVRIVPDDKFKKFDLGELAMTYNGSHNAFGNTASFHKFAAESIRKNGARPQLTPEKIKDKPYYVVTGKELSDASAWVKSADKATNYRGSSEQFDNMRAALKRYESFCEINKGAVLSTDLYAIRKSMLRDIAETSQEYIAYKSGVKDPNSYTTRRIDLAKSINFRAEAMSKEDFYNEMKNSLGPGEEKRYADGLKEYSDRALDEFNARMRKMAEEIAVKHGVLKKRDLTPPPINTDPTL